MPISSVLPSSSSLCVALYVCLSFCSCFSIFLFASRRIRSSSVSLSGFPLKQPMIYHHYRHHHRHQCKRISKTNKRRSLSSPKREKARTLRPLTYLSLAGTNDYDDGGLSLGSAAVRPVGRRRSGAPVGSVPSMAETTSIRSRG